MKDQPAQQPSIADVIDEILQEAAEAIARGVVTGEWLEANTKAALLAAFRSLAVAAAPEKYDNYTGTDMEDFQKGYHAGVSEYQANILAGLENSNE